ncbi:MAG: histidinol phosphate phosphatase domain-containing protein [Methanophagales archaeon]|nr:histidinol phosphate phosphatase domain-containing protein [Methanophagales archaeon]
MNMFDLHTHSIFSDGELIPSELVRRAVFNGYEAVAITDHVDFTNVEYVLTGLKNLGAETYSGIEVIIGVEITHVPADKIDKMVNRAKDLGAELIVVHGETLVEPVESGTNKAAVSNPLVDILAHPGIISTEEAELAKENDVYLEISSRHGHCLSNGHVARISCEVGAKLLLNSDLHSPDDFLTEELALRILAGAGLEHDEVKTVMSVNPKELLNKIK